MSKSFKTGLTGSGQRPSRRSKQIFGGTAERPAQAPARRQVFTASVDKLHDGCCVLEMLAQLMAGYSDEGPLPGETVRQAGTMLAEQVWKLRAAVTELEAAR
jgi:hypothetical protein